MNRGVILRILASLVFGFEIFVVLASRPAAVGQAPPSQRPQQKPLPPSTHRIYAPLPNGGWQDAELVLNNNRPDTLMVRPTFFSGGVAATGEPLTLGPGEARWVRLSELAPSAGRAATQNDAIELEYFGHPLELGAQIALLRGRGMGVVDIPFSMPGEGRSLIQEATWPVGAGTRAVVVLGNASEAFVFATLTGPDRVGERIELPPHGTRTIVREASSNPSPVDWMRVEVQGPTGSVRASGYVEAKGRFAAGIRFYDPEAARQGNLFATNLRVADTWPTLVLKNTANMTITVTPVFKGLRDDGELPVDLPSVVLGPYAAVTVPLSRLQDEAGRRPDLGQVSVHVSNSGPPGSLIGSLSAMSKDGSIAFDVPLREPGPLRKSTGSYPWRTDGDYNTVVTITNVADTSAKFLSLVTYAGGELELPMRELQPGATASFDMRQLEKLPGGVKSGQFRWSVIQSDGQTKLIGRAEIVSLSDTRTTSYSCEVCCTWNPLQGFLAPDVIAASIDADAYAEIHEPYADCYGWIHDIALAYPTEWLDVDPNVATIETAWEGAARAHGVAEGYTGVRGEWITVHVYGEWDGISPEYECYPIYWTNSASGAVQVACAYPVNFRRTHAGDHEEPGSLTFTYAWDSSFGNLGNLNQCVVGEYVTYDPGQIPFPVPFPPNSPPNPTERGVDGTDGAMQDNHTTPGDFRTPYSNETVTSVQVYGYVCGCPSGILAGPVMGPHNIDRIVYWDSGWKYRVDKTGVSAHPRELP